MQPDQAQQPPAQPTVDPNSTVPIQVGQEVTTKFGEKLVVLEIKQTPPVTKKGVTVSEGQTMFLAQSGEQKCWFGLSHLAKEAANG